MSKLISFPIISSASCTKSHKTSCKDCVTKTRSDAATDAIALISEEYASDPREWYLGFSGGKDSTALLCLLFQALANFKTPTKPVTVLFCDTGVEIPIMAALVRRTLRKIRLKAAELELPIFTKCARPALTDSYFVKIIGRGYPPPTNKFRWCTNRLRIDPVRRALGALGARSATVLVGVRDGESASRDRTLAKHKSTSGEHRFIQSGNTAVSLLAPILKFDTKDVWSIIHSKPAPTFLDADRLSELYSDAGAECPILKSEHSPPCGAGRFGCWTCTVVRKDKAITNLIAKGNSALAPLLAFRNWLMVIRDDPTYRCRFRRNGAPGPGPFTLAARKEILSRLRKTEARCPWQLIRSNELEEIRHLWTIDRNDMHYHE